MNGTCDSGSESPSVKYGAGTLELGDIWTASPRMKLCLRTAIQVAPLDIDLLILGETGTGKNLLAQAIHNASPRRNGPFVELNSASIPATLAENELFGHEAGAFTGATVQHRGLFEQAHGGTLCLDEVGSMPLEAQAKILSAVERKRVRRLGGEKPVECDVRLICATNVDVKSALASGALRQDLYFRLARCVLRVPCLRERSEDIPFLVERFLALDRATYNRAVQRVSAACLAQMLEYPWPGNVRELRARVNAAVAACEGTELQPRHVFPEPGGELASHSTPLVAASPSSGHPSLHVAASLSSGSPAPPEADLTLASAERRHIESVLAFAQWNITEAARLLGTTRPTLRDKIRRHGLAKPSP